MKRLVCKMIFITAVFIGVNWCLGGYAALCGAEPIVPWKIGFPGLLVLLFLSGVLAEKCFPQSIPKQKKVFRIYSLILFLLTLGVWGTVVLITLFS